MRTVMSFLALQVLSQAHAAAYLPAHQLPTVPSFARRRGITGMPSVYAPPIGLVFSGAALIDRESIRADFWLLNRPDLDRRKAASTATPYY